jgi:hypothetical protein
MSTHLLPSQIVDQEDLYSADMCEVSGCLACEIFVMLHIFRVSASGIVEKDFIVGINVAHL